jgi:Bacterial Ig-like domain (group 3)
MGRLAQSVVVAAMQLVVLVAHTTAVASALPGPAIERLTIAGVGTVPGVDYTQVTSTEEIQLSGRPFAAVVEEGGAQCNTIPSLPTGQTYTFISTSGRLKGTFAGLPNGSRIEIDRDGDQCERWRQPNLQIEYHETGSTQTVTATVMEGSPTPVSATTLSVGSAPLQINQSAALYTVIETSPFQWPASSPLGTVTFLDEGTPLAGCASLPVATLRSLLSAGAGCSTPFPNGRFLEQIEAVFMPAEHVALLGSKQSESIAIERGTTTASVQVSEGAAVDRTVTYTATVTPRYLGPIVPSGTVEFRDGARPIEACESQPLTRTGMVAQAVCRVSYPTVGTHSIAASYTGETEFSGSTAPALAVEIPLTPKTGTSGEGSSNEESSSHSGAGESNGTTSTGSTTSTVAATRSTSPPAPAVSDPPAVTGVPMFSSAALTARKLFVRSKKDDLVQLHCKDSTHCSGTAVVYERSTALIPLRCAVALPCRGTLSLAVRAAPAQRRGQALKEVAIGSGDYALPARSLALGKVELNAAGKALLKADHGTLNADLGIAVQGAAAQPVQNVAVKLLASH